MPVDPTTGLYIPDDLVDAQLAESAQLAQQPIPEPTLQMPPEEVPVGPVPASDPFDPSMVSPEYAEVLAQADQALAQPDAVSGADFAPKALEQPDVQFEPVDPYGPEPEPDIATKWMNVQLEEQRRQAEAEVDAIREAQLAREELSERVGAEIKEIGEMKPWKDRVGTPQRIAALIGGVLGGFVAHRSGGRNLFNEQLAKTIDRDMELQRQQINQKLKALQTEAGAEMSGIEFQLRGDLAEAKLRSAAYYDVAAQFNEAAMKAKNEQAQRDALMQQEKALREAEKHKQESLTWYYELEKLKAETDKIRGETRGARGTGGSDRPRETGLIIDPLVTAGVVSPEDAAGTRGKRVVALPVTNANGNQQEAFLTLDDKIADDLNKRGDAFESALELMPSLARQVQRTGKGDLNTRLYQSKDGAKLATQYNKLLLKFKEIENLGVLNGRDLDVLKDITGQDPTAIENLTRGQILSNLEELYRLTSDDIKRRVSRGSAGTATYEAPDFQSLVGTVPTNVAGPEEIGKVLEAAHEPGRGRDFETKVDANSAVFKFFKRKGINEASIDDARAALDTLLKAPKEERVVIKAGTTEETRLDEWLANEIANYEQRIASEPGVTDTTREQMKREEEVRDFDTSPNLPLRGY